MGWRFDGSVHFDRVWTECEHGFGDMAGEYWLGMIKMHRLAASAPQELRINLEDFQGDQPLCTLQYLHCGYNATKQYCLTVSGYSGTVDDDMRYSSGARFSMKDRKNDTSRKLQCAVVRGGPWWRLHCTQANLNGKYYTTPVKGGNVIFWISWHHATSLKKVDMKIRRK